MSKNRMIYLGMAAAVVLAAFWGWKLTSRSAYESAAYSVLESEGVFELREYPDLMMATTASNFGSQGKDGSFMRLFRYISGSNESGEKVAMTTPVFMEPSSDERPAQMGFVIPREVTENSIPQPTAGGVDIRERAGGKFAVVRFAGQLNEQTRRDQESRLQEWIDAKKLVRTGTAESAGYDPPFVPGFLRRNEVLVRVNSAG